MPSFKILRLLVFSVFVVSPCFGTGTKGVSIAPERMCAPSKLGQPTRGVAGDEGLCSDGGHKLGKTIESVAKVKSRWKTTVLPILGVTAVTLGVARTQFSFDSEYFKNRKTDAYVLESKIIAPDRVFEVKLSDGPETLSGVIVKSSDPLNTPTIVYFIGKDGGLNNHWRRVENLYPSNLNVLLIEYQGYGKSTGTPTLEAVFKNVNAVWEQTDLFADQINVKDLFLYGYSLGGIFATYLGAHGAKEPKGVILEATPSSTSANIKQKLGIELWPPILFNKSFNLTADLEKIFKDRSHIPVLGLFRSDDDRLKHSLHGERIFQLFKKHNRSENFFEVVSRFGPKTSTDELPQDSKHWQIPQYLGLKKYNEIITDFVNKTGR
jgi:pimeloyl-ACP methyl ester carboxylesterase